MALVWSLSPGAAETVRGRKYHYVVLDEAALAQMDLEQLLGLIELFVYKRHGAYP